LVKSAVFYL